MTMLHELECPNVVELFIAESKITSTNLVHNKALNIFSFGFGQKFIVYPEVSLLFKTTKVASRPVVT